MVMETNQHPSHPHTTTTDCARCNIAREWLNITPAQMRALPKGVNLKHAQERAEINLANHPNH